MNHIRVYQVNKREIDDRENVFIFMINAFITPTREEVFLKIEDLTVTEFFTPTSLFLIYNSIDGKQEKKEEKPTLLNIVVGLLR